MIIQSSFSRKSDDRANVGSMRRSFGASINWSSSGDWSSHSRDQRWQPGRFKSGWFVFVSVFVPVFVPVFVSVFVSVFVIWLIISHPGISTDSPSNAADSPPHAYCANRRRPSACVWSKYIFYITQCICSNSRMYLSTACSLCKSLATISMCASKWCAADHNDDP